MNVLVLNAGSSSLKYKLWEMPAERALAWGLLERLGESAGVVRYRHQAAERAERQGQCPCRDHRQALALALAELPGGLAGVHALGHRVVHGGELFKRPTLVDDKTLEDMRGLIPLAPLHMPPAIACLQACRELLPGRPQVAHFDTMFHQSMPPHAYLYPLPHEWHRLYGARRYGFHGSSHEYAVLEASRRLGRPARDLRLVTAHLGNGASLTAWDRGRVLDTSMGFTPLEGVMMGTRPGWIDAALVPYLAERRGTSAQEVVERLNHDGGLKGVSGLGRDLRGIVAAMAQGHERARLAFDMFVFRLLKCLGGYVFALGGADAVTLTGGIGENSVEVRQALFAGTAPLGMVLDQVANREMAGGAEGVISAPESPVKIMVLAAGEELMIARAVRGLLAGEGVGSKAGQGKGEREKVRDQ